MKLGYVQIIRDILGEGPRGGTGGSTYCHKNFWFLETLFEMVLGSKKSCLTARLGF